ncbi:MAG TPA: hypothetical protein PKV41_05465, partial [Candidatus Omnitrophota bacterium]|nr:hypothetical protein [Candidatus Omnitrophota bacterium]
TRTTIIHYPGVETGTKVYLEFGQEGARTFKAATEEKYALATEQGSLFFKTLDGLTAYAEANGLDLQWTTAVGREEYAPILSVEAFAGAEVFEGLVETEDPLTGELWLEAKPRVAVGLPINMKGRSGVFVNYPAELGEKSEEYSSVQDFVNKVDDQTLLKILENSGTIVWIWKDGRIAGRIFIGESLNDPNTKIHLFKTNGQDEVSMPLIKYLHLMNNGGLTQEAKEAAAAAVEEKIKSIENKIEDLLKNEPAKNGEVSDSINAKKLQIDEINRQIRELEEKLKQKQQGKEGAYVPQAGSSMAHPTAHVDVPVMTPAVLPVVPSRMLMMPLVVPGLVKGIADLFGREAEAAELVRDSKNIAQATQQETEQDLLRQIEELKRQKALLEKEIKDLQGLGELTKQLNEQKMILRTINEEDATPYRANEIVITPAHRLLRTQKATVIIEEQKGLENGEIVKTIINALAIDRKGNTVIEFYYEPKTAHAGDRMIEVDGKAIYGYRSEVKRPVFYYKIQENGDYMLLDENGKPVNETGKAAIIGYADRRPAWTVDAGKADLSAEKYSELLKFLNSSEDYVMTAEQGTELMVQGREEIAELLENMVRPQREFLRVATEELTGAQAHSLNIRLAEEFNAKTDALKAGLTDESDPVKMAEALKGEVMAIAAKIKMIEQENANFDFIKIAESQGITPAEVKTMLEAQIEQQRKELGSDEVLTQYLGGQIDYLAFIQNRLIDGEYVRGFIVDRITNKIKGEITRVEGSLTDYFIEFKIGGDNLITDAKPASMTYTARKAEDEYSFELTSEKPIDESYLRDVDNEAKQVIYEGVRRYADNGRYYEVEYREARDFKGKVIEIVTGQDFKERRIYERETKGRHAYVSPVAVESVGMILEGENEIVRSTSRLDKVNGQYIY